MSKDPIQEGIFVESFGLEGDAHGGDWHRQVSILAQESIDKIAARGIKDLFPGRFAENITTEGIILHELPVGMKLLIGETLQEVTQIGKKCHSRCGIYHTVGDCVMPKEGIFTKVIKGGRIKIGDLIKILG
nr:MOSC domain-containing protein [Alkaliphilus hydrothermalis]